MKLGTVEFGDQYKLTKRDLGILTVFVDNHDSLSGSGEISVKGCPDTVQVTPMSQPLTISSNSSVPFLFDFYNSDLDPTPSVANCTIYLRN